MDRIYYHLSIQLDGLIHVSRDESIKQQKKFGNINDRCSCKEAGWHSRQCVHEIDLLNIFEPTYFDFRWKARDMVTCCHDVGVYKNPKMIENFKINYVDILRTDETMIESYGETNNVTSENDESVKDIHTIKSLLSPINDDKNIQYDED